MVKYIALILLLILAGLIIISGCGPIICLDAGALSPKDLLVNSQYVFTANLKAIDALAYLGEIEYYGVESDFFILEYSLSPLEIIKGDTNIKEFKLWYPSFREKPNNIWHTLEFSDSKIELAYGNEVANWSEIIHVLEPRVNFPFHLLIKMLNGIRLSEEKDTYESWLSAEADSTLASLLVNSPKLHTAFEISSANAIVIYGTEFCMFTQYEFHEGDVTYCHVERDNGDIKWVWGFWDSREQYLRKLRRYAEEGL